MQTEKNPWKIPIGYLPPAVPQELFDLNWDAIMHYTVLCYPCLLLQLRRSQIFFSVSWDSQTQLPPHLLQVPIKPSLAYATLSRHSALIFKPHTPTFRIAQLIICDVNNSHGPPHGWPCLLKIAHSAVWEPDFATWLSDVCVRKTNNKDRIWAIVLIVMKNRSSQKRKQEQK